jgi:hypothetical protein
MRTTLLVLLFLTLCLAARGDESSVASPDGRYAVRLHHKPNSVFPLILLRDIRSGNETEVFDYESVGQGTTGLHAVWSPDSRHVAFTIAVGPATQEFAVYRIANGTVRELEILPIPKSLDAPHQGHRGGPSVNRWEDSHTLWINDGQKNRAFRYRITKQSKLLADGFKEDKPE